MAGETANRPQTLQKDERHPIIMATDPVEKTNVNAESVLGFQATLLSHDRFDEAATAFATDLALKLGLERVSIGVIERGQTQIKAISHSADIQAKHEAHRRIAGAMDEAIKQAAVIVFPETANAQPRVMQAHAALARGPGNQACTIPLTRNGRIFGAMTFERSAASLFEKDEIATFEDIASLLGPVLFLKWDEGLPWHARFMQEWSAWKDRHFADAGSGVKPGLLALATLIALLSIPVQYNISAPARLEGSIQRALVAPEKGYLQQAYVRPGDRVQANQVLAELADQDLLLEKRRWQSELAQHENAGGAALAQSDRVQIVINQAKAEEARTGLVLVEEKLSRSRIVAPFDGIIIKGDLRQSLGAPVQGGDVLLTIAPADAFRLMIEVDERDVSGVLPLQEGKATLASLPDKALAFLVQRVTPVATTRDGRNFFEVEGSLKTTGPVALRPGLEGVAKIGIGKRPLIWILTHRIIDWARLALWSFGL